MGLLERTKKALLTLLGEVPSKTEPTGYTDPDSITTAATQQATELDPTRSARLKDFDLMDDGVIAAQLDVIVNAALVFEEPDTEIENPLLKADCFKVEIGGYNTKAASS